MATLLAMRTRARTAADQDSATFPTDTQYNLWLNEAMREVWADLMTAGWPVNYTTATITANGSSSYLIGTSVFSVRAVWRVDGGNRIEVPRLDESSKGTLLSQAQNGRTASYEVLVDATGTVLRLYPAV